MSQQPKWITTLTQVKKELKDLFTQSDKISATVILYQQAVFLQKQREFVRIILQLKKKKNKEFEKLINFFSRLQNSLEQIEQSKYVKNTAKSGDPITADDIFIGNAFGMSMHSASYWLSQQAKLDKKNWTYVHDYLAGEFVRSGILNILELIDNIFLEIDNI